MHASVPRYARLWSVRGALFGNKQRPRISPEYSLTYACAHIGKTTFFVANQEKLEDVSAEKLAGLEKEHKDIEEENKTLAAEVRALSTGIFFLLHPIVIHE